MSIEQTWDEYKRHHDGDYFTDNASVVFIPTASGARGYDAVRQFLAAAYDPRVLGIKEHVISKTVGQDTIVEESDTTINFVTGEGSWIVPGVDSRYLVDNKVVIPTVTTAKFEGERIISIRIYWDQASVLKQLKLITEKNSWPIVAERQVDALRDVSNAHLNPFSRNDLAAGVARMNINQQQPPPQGRRNVHTSSRVLMPGGTGGKSSVFGDDQEDAVSNRRFNSNKNQSQFSIGDDNESVQYERPAHSQKKINPNSNASQFQIGDDFVDEQSKRRGNDDGSAPRTAFKPSSRITKPPGGGGSQITFG